MTGKAFNPQRTSLKPPPQQASLQEHLNCSRKIPLYCTWTVFKGAKTPVPTDSALVCRFSVESAAVDNDKQCFSTSAVRRNVTLRGVDCAKSPQRCCLPAQIQTAYYCCWPPVVWCSSLELEEGQRQSCERALSSLIQHDTR